MMKMKLTVAMAAIVLVAGCKGESAAPTGQVLATVNGEEITAADLRMEMDGATAPTQEAQKQMERAALQSIVNRRLIVAAAKEQDLDDLPAYAMAKRKAEELALINVMQKKVAGAVPAPSPEEAQRYVTEHPGSFADRKIMAVQQLVVGPVGQDVLQELRPLKTLEQVVNFLRSRNIEFRPNQAVIDPLQADPEVVGKVAALPPNEVFVIPGPQGGLVINQIVDQQPAPVPADKAVQVATQILKARRTQEAVQQQIKKAVDEGAAKVSYNEAYKPNPATATAGGAPATAPR